MAMFPSILGAMHHQCWVCTNPLLLPMDDIGNSMLGLRNGNADNAWCEWALKPPHTKCQRQLMAMFPSILGAMHHQCWVCTNPLLLPMDDIGNSMLGLCNSNADARCEWALSRKLKTKTMVKQHVPNLPDFVREVKELKVQPTWGNLHLVLMKSYKASFCRDICPLSASQHDRSLKIRISTLTAFLTRTQP